MLTEAACNGINIVHAGNEGREDSADSGFFIRLCLSPHSLSRCHASDLRPMRVCTTAAMHCEFVYCSLNTMTGKGGKFKGNEITTEARRHPHSLIVNALLLQMKLLARSRWKLVKLP